MKRFIFLTIVSLISITACAASGVKNDCAKNIKSQLVNPDTAEFLTFKQVGVDTYEYTIKAETKGSFIVHKTLTCRPTVRLACQCVEKPEK